MTKRRHYHPPVIEDSYQFREGLEIRRVFAILLIGLPSTPRFKDVLYLGTLLRWKL